MTKLDQITKKIIKLIKEGKENDKAFTDREVTFFRFLTKYRQAKKPTGAQLHDVIKKNLPVFGFSPDSLTHYVNTFTQNYRADGKYNETLVGDLVNYSDMKSKRITNVNARDYVDNLKPFKGSNLEGKWEKDYRGDWGYVVTSYDWYPIYIYKYKKWFEVDDRYSSSTGKQMSKSRPSATWSGSIKLGRREMDKIRNGVDVDEFMGSKTKSFTEKIDNLIDSNTVERIRMGWYPRFRVTFTYTGVRIDSGTPEISINVSNVEKIVNNKLDREAGDFFNDEMEGVTKEMLEDLIKGYLSEKWYQEFGESENNFNKKLVVNVDYQR
jgi:hypothetical protein